MSRARSVEPLRYVVATHSWAEGAKLSKRGHWGNLPYADREAATAAAHADAGENPFSIEHKTLRR